MNSRVYGGCSSSAEDSDTFQRTVIKRLPAPEFGLSLVVPSLAALWKLTMTAARLCLQARHGDRWHQQLNKKKKMSFKA